MNTSRLRRPVWFVSGATFGLVVAALTTQAFMVSAGADPSGSTFVPIAPCRLFDYRPSSGVGTRNIPVGPDETVVQQITGAVGACNIPPTATGVAINVTITGPTAASNLRIFPADVAVPNASNLNWSARQKAASHPSSTRPDTG